MKTNRLIWILNEWALCVEKVKSIAVLLNLLHYFYHRIKIDKTCNFVHGKAFEVQHEICRSELRSLKDTQNLLRKFNFHQIFSGYHQSYIFDDSVNFCKLLDWKYLFVGCFKSITVIWNILHLFLSVDKMVQWVWLIKLMPLRYKIC